MASALKNLSEYNETTLPSAENVTFGVVLSEWNASITHALYEACFDTLIKHGADPEKIHTIQVPGTFELPIAAKHIAGKHNVDATICLGCVIKGETKHDEYISYSVANALQSLSIMSGKPFIFGVLTTDNEAQALDRAGGKHGNKGVEAAITAIRMANLKKDLTEPKKRIGF